MKIVCIDNKFPDNFHGKSFTIGKVYNFIPWNNTNETFGTIKDDDNISLLLSRDTINLWFKTLDKAREDKINNLLK
jgi:hypothetical protein